MIAPEFRLRRTFSARRRRRRRLASYGFLWRRRLASYGRRRLGFLWSPPWLPMVAALASYGLLALAS